MNVSFELQPEVVEAIAQRAAELVADQAPPAARPWLDVDGAAEHLACPKSRIYALTSAGRIPHHKDGSRNLYSPDELDAWVRGGGGLRP